MSDESLQAKGLDDDDLDRLMQTIGHSVPSGFTDRVLLLIDPGPEAQEAERVRPALVPVDVGQQPEADTTQIPALSPIRVVLVLGVGLFGVGQIVRVMASLWLASAAW